MSARSPGGALGTMGSRNVVIGAQQLGANQHRIHAQRIVPLQVREPHEIAADAPFGKTLGAHVIDEAAGFHLLNRRPNLSLCRCRPLERGARAADDDGEAVAPQPPWRQPAHASLPLRDRVKLLDAHRWKVLVHCGGDLHWREAGGKVCADLLRRHGPGVLDASK